MLRVRDTGEGIPPEHLPHVFDRFYKADASRRESSGSGSGLGLSIVKAIVERHGGRITVTSTPGEGTIFEVVPAAERVGVRPQAPPPTVLSRAHQPRRGEGKRPFQAETRWHAL